MSETEPPPEPVIIELGSVTVFWDKDLGMTKKLRDAAASNARLGQRIADSVEEWLSGNAKGPFRIYDQGVWFLDKKDAALFKLFWNGKWDDWNFK